MSVCYYFFFQAEDGILDTSVTGVQTCALPIFSSASRAFLRAPEGGSSRSSFCSCFRECCLQLIATSTRSEERRVGNECDICRFRSARVIDLIHKSMTI